VIPLNTSPSIEVPFFRPAITDQEIGEVIDTLRSGWLTTGPKAKRFEDSFAHAVRAKHAVAVNSCTAALHLAAEALNLRPGEGVLVPTMTFAATAEVIRYQGAIPILVDCDARTMSVDLEDAQRKLDDLRMGRLPATLRSDIDVVGIIPVHVGGMMIDPHAVREFSRRNGLWTVEDAAHAFPAAWRPDSDSPWRHCGDDTADVTCFSFYANKTITTGEGGMAVTNKDQLAARIRMMALHGLSNDAWNRYSSGGSWDYRICAPGFKYNLTDIAAAIGIHQLGRAEQLRSERESVANRYLEELGMIDEIEMPANDNNRLHSWHLFPIKLKLKRLSIDRNSFIAELKRAGIGCSVHWRPLHLHPYYQETFGWRASDCPVASVEWERLVSLPIFPGMREEELLSVVRTVKGLAVRYQTPRVAPHRVSI
jgi:dTDP-4-amino-4,6-dideoxygalactose transaminase